MESETRDVPETFESAERTDVKPQDAWAKLIILEIDARKAYQAFDAASVARIAAIETFYEANSASGRVNELEVDGRRAHKRMKSAFAKADKVRLRRNNESNVDYTRTGKKYEALRDQYSEESRLIAEKISKAREARDKSEEVYWLAKAQLSKACQAFFEAFADYECSSAQCPASGWVPVELDLARKLSAETQRIIDAFVPPEFGGDAWVFRRGVHEALVYFGGQGLPNGHGYRVLKVDLRGLTD